MRSVFVAPLAKPLGSVALARSALTASGRVAFRGMGSSRRPWVRPPHPLSEGARAQKNRDSRLSRREAVVGSGGRALCSAPRRGSSLRPLKRRVSCGSVERPPGGPSAWEVPLRPVPPGRGSQLAAGLPRKAREKTEKILARESASFRPDDVRKRDSVLAAAPRSQDLFPCSAHFCLQRLCGAPQRPSLSSRKDLSTGVYRWRCH